MGGELRSEKRDVGRRMSVLPQVHQLLSVDWVQASLQAHPRPLVLRVLRGVLDHLRQQLLQGEVDIADKEQAIAWIANAFAVGLAEALQGKLRKVLNGTGVVINTNLGRAPLPSVALERMHAIASGYCNLEYDLDTRARGGRMAGIRKLISVITGAAAAHVVNNNAAAVMLALGAMAKGKEVIISRGELVEIGGSFRIPEVMEAAGVVLREVGTTNRTHLRDYEEAINENTGLLLKVHQSNFALVGFTKEVSVEQLVALGKTHDLPVMVDLGSGSLLSLEQAGVTLAQASFAVPSEPTLTDMIKAGVDVVASSCDKLLGGPQAGLLVGASEWVERAAKMPVARALRVDKLTLAALEATLQLYADYGEKVTEQVPVWRALIQTQEELKERGEVFLEQLKAIPGIEVTLCEGQSTVGGGALPSSMIPTILLAIKPQRGAVESIDLHMRQRTIPIVGLLDRGRWLLDLRTLLEEELALVAEALEELPRLHLVK